VGDSFLNANDDCSSQTRTAVLTVSLGASFLTPFMVSSVNIALPSIGRDLSIGAVLLSWITTAYLLSSTVLLIPFGKIADSFGRKKIFSFGMSLLTVSSFLSILSTNGIFLIATRVLHGVGSAMIFGTGIAMLTAVFPQEKRGRMLGINVSFVYLGLMCGPVIGGFLVKQFGWRSLFWVNIPVGMAILGVVRFAIAPEWVEKIKEPFDRWGALLYGSSVAMVLIGFSRLTHSYGIPLFFLGAVGCALFLYVESRNDHPMLPISLFKSNRVFAFSNIAALINYSTTYAVGFLMSLYLQYIKGLPPDRAGFIMVVQPVVMVIGSPLAGRLSDRIEPRIPASIGMGCSAVGLILLSRLSATTPMEVIVVNLAVIGLGFALFSSPNTSAVMGSVDRTKYGIASATIGTMRLLGQIFSMGLTMLLISIMIGEGKITGDLYPQFLKVVHLMGMLFSGLSVIGVAVSMVRGNLRE
jgi:EmrB/QacA subfamily drug resistance transporter